MHERAMHTIDRWSAMSVPEYSFHFILICLTLFYFFFLCIPNKIDVHAMDIPTLERCEQI